MASLKNILIICCLLVGARVPAAAYYYDIQARIGPYYGTCHRSTQAFQRATPVYQLEASCFFSQPWEWVPWKAWINGSFMAGNGNSDTLGRTNSNMTTLSLGLKHSWMIDRCGGEFYLGYGPTLSWLRIKTDRPLPEGFWDGQWHGHRKISKKQLGVVLKSGFRMIFCKDILVDVFGDYQLTTFHYKNYSKKHLFHAVPAENQIDRHSRRDGRHRLDLSGFVVGGAIGVPF